MTEEKRVQFDNKEIRKQRRGDWVDKNWIFVIRGWNLSFILCVISSGIYSWNPSKRTFNLSIFFKNIIGIGGTFLVILTLLLLIMMVFSKNKSEILYLFFIIGLSFTMILISNKNTRDGALISSYILNAFIGICYCYLRYKKKLTSISKNSIKGFISFLMPIITTVISSLLK